MAGAGVGGALHRTGLRSSTEWNCLCDSKVMWGKKKGWDPECLFHTSEKQVWTSVKCTVFLLVVPFSHTATGPKVCSLLLGVEFEPNTYSCRPPGGAQYSHFPAPFILFMHQSLRLYSSLHFRLFFFFFFPAVNPGRQSEIRAAWYELLKGHVPINCITKRKKKRKKKKKKSIRQVFQRSGRLEIVT